MTQREAIERELRKQFDLIRRITPDERLRWLWKQRIWHDIFVDWFRHKFYRETCDWSCPYCFEEKAKRQEERHFLDWGDAADKAQKAGRG